MSDILKHELSPIPLFIVDEYGSLQKGNTSIPVKSIRLVAINPIEPNDVLVDDGKLLYHVVWPVAGTNLDLANSFAKRLSK